MRISDWSSDVCSSDLLPQRQAGEGAGQHLLDDLCRRLVDIDRQHVLAVDHDLLDPDVAEIEDRAQHGALMAILLAPALVHLASTEELILGRPAGNDRKSVV